MLKNHWMSTARACVRCSRTSSLLARPVWRPRRLVGNPTAKLLHTSSARFTQTSDTHLHAHHGPRSSITCTCSSLSTQLDGKTVTLGGWLYSQRRASANLHFFTLRDSSGSVQLVSRNATISAKLMQLPLDSVIQVTGIAQRRKQAAKSTTSIPSEALEIELSDATLLNPADKLLPFYPNRPEVANEDLRAQYRYLDLRRAELAENLKLRSRVAHLIRNYLHDAGFTEVETPVLLNSSPEGAREYLVPTRTSSSSTTPTFYALQQSPQQPKQLLIASGAVDKYYQIARCFRDEDGRKDRQPEFTQIDMEMAFVSGASEKQDSWGIGGREVKDTVEGIIRKIWSAEKGVELGDFRIMPYQIAMDVYGSDKPDTRYEMYTLPIGYYPGLSDADIDKVLLDKSAFTVEWMITRAEDARCLDIEALTSGNHYVDHVKITEANRDSWAKESPLTQNMNLELSADGAVAGGSVEPGDIIWLAQRKKIAEGGWTHLGRLRTLIADALVAKGALELPADPHFLWITQFPLFTQADDDKAFLAKGRWASSHHPFTAPMFEDLEALKKGDIQNVRGQHYDLVLNGQEIGGGSVRIHDAKLQEHIMIEVLKLDEEEVGRFSHLLQALKFGAPPHGGIALGFDRLVAILAGAKSIREVIAFPKTTGGSDPVFKSPSVAKDDILRGYGLQAIPSSEP